MTDDVATVLSDGIATTARLQLDALREVGQLLGQAIDSLQTEVNELRQHVEGLQGRVSALEDGRP